MADTLETTIEEMERKLKILEDQFIGSTASSSSKSPFQPLTSLRRRIEALKGSDSEETARSITTTAVAASRLPAVNLPSFDGSDLETFLKEFSRWLRLTGLTNAQDTVKCDWLIQACTIKVKKILEKLVDDTNNEFSKVLDKMEVLFPRLENDISLREALKRIPQLPREPEPQQVAQLLLEFEDIIARMSPEALGEQEKLLMLITKVHPQTFQELRKDRLWKRRTESFDDLKNVLQEKAQEDFFERHIFSQKKQALHTIQAQDEGKGKGKGKGHHQQERNPAQESGKGKEKGQGKGK